MAQRIIITIPIEGEPTIETKGYYGTACKEASRFMEEALGVKTSDKPTAEYHQTNPNSNSNRQQIGGK